MENGLLTGICSLDIMKCFDTINHSSWKMSRNHNHRGETHGEKTQVVSLHLFILEKGKS